MAVLVADVPLGTGETLVMRWGDWVGWIALAGLALFHLVDFGLMFKKTSRSAQDSR
jgi:apolipoprotein N-acyltransferase